MFLFVSKVVQRYEINPKEQLEMVILLSSHAHNRAKSVAQRLILRFKVIFFAKVLCHYKIKS